MEEKTENNSISKREPLDISKVRKSLEITNKILTEGDNHLRTFDYQKWWDSLDVVWKKFFKYIIEITTEPSNGELIKIVNLENIPLLMHDNIYNLKPLEIFRNLKTVDLYRCSEIENLEHLRFNLNLECLNIRGTKVTKLDTLKNFTNLIELECSDYVISLEPIRHLTKLKTLSFWLSDKINSLDALKSLDNLEMLEISDNICDLSPIDNLNNLRQIVCFGVTEDEALRFKMIHKEVKIINSEKEKVWHKMAEKLRTYKRPFGN